MGLTSQNYKEVREKLRKMLDQKAQGLKAKAESAVKAAESAAKAAEAAKSAKPAPTPPPTGASKTVASKTSVSQQNGRPSTPTTGKG